MDASPVSAQDHGPKANDLLGFARVQLHKRKGKVEQQPLQLGAKIAGNRQLLIGPMMVSFCYEIGPAAPSAAMAETRGSSSSDAPADAARFPGWYRINLTGPTPGQYAQAVWQESVLRTLSKDNDFGKGTGCKGLNQISQPKVANHFGFSPL